MIYTLLTNLTLAFHPLTLKSARVFNSNRSIFLLNIKSVKYRAEIIFILLTPVPLTLYPFSLKSIGFFFLSRPIILPKIKPLCQMVCKILHGKILFTILTPVILTFDSLTPKSIGKSIGFYLSSLSRMVCNILCENDFLHF